jgi:FkbM family methyltransferase
MISYAQNAEDVVLARLFDAQQAGTWIDVGAGHPVDDSVTKHFADRGWRGLNIEPNPDLHKSLLEQRPEDVNLAVAASEAPGRATLWFGDESERFNSTIDESVSGDGWQGRDVELVSVWDVAIEHGFQAPDFLKIDVEGVETAVLRGAELEKLQPRVLVIEAIHPVTHQPSHSEWEALVVGAGYRLALFDGVNRFYARSKDDAALTALASPANIIDDFEPWRWRRQIEDQRSQVADATAYAASLESSRGEAVRYAEALDKRLRDLGAGLLELLEQTERLAR